MALQHLIAVIDFRQDSGTWIFRIYSIVAEVATDNPFRRVHARL